MLRIARVALLLLVVSLAFMKPALRIDGLQATLTDGFYLVVVVALAGALAAGQARLRWTNGFLILIAYFAAMLVAVLVAGTLAEAVPRLASQLYLLSLPVLIFALIDDRDDLRRLMLAWLAGTAVCTAIGVVTVILFVVGIDRAAIDFALHGFGTLPPGAYPRLEATFNHPAMLCNYLTVSLAILLICLHLSWIGRAAGYCLLGAIMVTAAFTITPGLGGIALLLGAWLFVTFRIRARLLAIASLMAASALAIAFVAVSVATPILHKTAPFLIDLPFLEMPLAPSVRLLAWIEAGHSILEHPLFGVGLGSEPIAVLYDSPSGDQHILTDAHNVYLDIAMYSGVLGLAAILVLIGFVVRQMHPWQLTDASVISFGLGLAWLNAFAYQGLTGSYEDARHLWLLLGLLFAAIRLQAQPPGERAA